MILQVLYERGNTGKKREMKTRAAGCLFHDFGYVRTKPLP